MSSIAPRLRTIQINNHDALAFSMGNAAPGRRAYYRDANGMRQEIPYMDINALTDSGQVLLSTDQGPMLLAPVSE